MGSTIVDVTPTKILLPRIDISNCKPEYATTGIEYDNNIEIPFNKEMNSQTFTLSSTDSIQIVNANSGISYEQYFEIDTESFIL